MVQRSDLFLRALILSSSLCGILGLSPSSNAVQVLFGSEDIPEEVLQIQVDEAAFSQLDGGRQSPSEYAQEQQQLQIKPENVPARISPEVKQLIDLLRIRKAILDLIPFL